MEEKKEPRIKILVACHKADLNIRQDDIYMPIQVGKALHPELDLGFQCDNTGDNISEKNGSYCELTALYWAWKNLKDVDYIGLCHYRRYFDFKTLGTSVRIVNYTEFKQSQDFDVPISRLRTDKVILPSFWSSPNSIWTNFSSHVMTQDLYILYKIIAKYSPEYLTVFEKYLIGNRRTGYNMFIMSFTNFQLYCEWLFFILDKVEKCVKLSSYISYQRLFGYLGEILLPVYCKANHIEIDTTRVAICYEYRRILNTFGKKQIKDLLFNISHHLSNIPRKKTLADKYWEQYLKLDKIDI